MTVYNQPRLGRFAGYRPRHESQERLLLFWESPASAWSSRGPCNSEDFMRILVAGSCGLALLALGACKTREGNTADTTAARTDTAVARVGAATDTGARRVDS